jgi:hypothetical protein
LPVPKGIREKLDLLDLPEQTQLYLDRQDHKAQPELTPLCLDLKVK